MKIVQHWVMTGTVTLLSGTRIGGSDDMLQIGGTDLTCIKDPATGMPYLPGSSIKGRMRSGLEKRLGKASSDGKPCGCAEDVCPVCRVFGPHMNKKQRFGPTRIIVRDAMLRPEVIPTFELKTESINNRATGAAQHPRTVERVAPGAKFALEIGIQEFDVDKDFKYTYLGSTDTVAGYKALWAVVIDALGELEATGLGSGTGKGSGRVAVETDPIAKVVQSRRAIFLDSATNG